MRLSRNCNGNRDWQDVFKLTDKRLCLHEEKTRIQLRKLGDATAGYFREWGTPPPRTDEHHDGSVHDAQVSIRVCARFSRQPVDRN